MTTDAVAGRVEHPHARRHRHPGRRLRQFARTPKGLVTFVLVLLTAIAARVEGVQVVGPGLTAAVLTAGVLDACVLRWRRGRWMFPTGAVLTGILIAGVLGSYEPWYVFVTASGVAIVSKYALRTRTGNIFNPAALGLVVVFYAFQTAQNWWGALPAIVPAAAWPLLVGTGLYVTHRVNKLPLVVAFLASYFALFSALTFVMDVREVAEVFVAPDLLAAVFFACFMLTDPPTSPTRFPAQVVCGVLVAAASVAVFVGLGAAHYLLSGVLVGNVFEAARRWYQSSRRPAEAGRHISLKPDATSE